MFLKTNKNSISFLVAFSILVFIAGCSRESNPVTSSNQVQSLDKPLSTLDSKALKVQQVNLVSSVSSFPGARIDPNLVNAWGIAFNPNGKFWISANGTGLSVVYDENGNQQRAPVTIPTVNNAPGGTPTGALFNYTNTFRLPDNKPSLFIFVGEDGIVSAWGPSSGNNAVVVADQSSQTAVYKGAAIASFKGKNYLYAANFKHNKVDVFDSKFKLVNLQFNDPNIPVDFAPFDIKLIDGRLFVTYAKQKGPDNMDDLAGPGNGFIDVFSTGGKLIHRFASNGTLNSPWGLTVANLGKGKVLLVGNFGDGHINIFNLGGKFIDQLKDQNSKTLVIDGLWGLFSLNADNDSDNHKGKDKDAGKRIYFTAGPSDESEGLFGYLKVQ